MRGASKPVAKSPYLAGGQLVASSGKLALGQAGFGHLFFPGSGCSWVLAAPGLSLGVTAPLSPLAPAPCPRLAAPCPRRAPREPGLELEPAAPIPLQVPPTFKAAESHFPPPFPPLFFPAKLGNPLGEGQGIFPIL